MKPYALLIAWFAIIPRALGLFSGPCYVNNASAAAFAEAFADGSPESIWTPEEGSADFLQAHIVEPWPKRSKKHRVVKYCYADDASAAILSCMMQAGISLWSDALGGPASKNTGHSLAFYEVKGKDGKPVRCYADYDAKTMTGKWNPEVDGDVLAVRYNDQHLYQSTVGYMYKSMDNTPGRHIMNLGDLKNGEERIVAHEIGHALGMTHEAQRTDRDNYIVYRCNAVQGFLAAMSAAIADGTPAPDAFTKLCENSAFALKYKFPGWLYTKGSGFMGIPIDGDGGFDYDSIMMYPSWGYALQPDECKNGDMLKCPIAGLVMQNGVKVGETLLQWATKPSRRDVEFVRKYYPWED